MTKSQAYEILDLPFDATEKEIKSRYVELAKLYHTDNGGENDKMINLNLAFEAIKTENFDPESQQYYNKFYEDVYSDYDEFVQDRMNFSKEHFHDGYQMRDKDATDELNARNTVSQLKRCIFCAKPFMSFRLAFSELLSRIGYRIYAIVTGLIMLYEVGIVGATVLALEVGDFTKEEFIPYFIVGIGLIIFHIIFRNILSYFESKRLFYKVDLERIYGLK